MFLETFKGDLRDLQGYQKEVKRAFRESFKTVDRCIWKFQECLRKVISVFQEKFKKKLSRVFQTYFKKFCFAIYLLHGFYRS